MLIFPHCLFGAVSQSYLRCYLSDCSPHFAPNKTYLTTRKLCIFFSQKENARKEMEKKDLPWWSSGQGSAVSLLRALVQFLVGELRSHKLPILAKKRKNKR